MMASSAEGGRRGWQGLRFEAAFAALNLVRGALKRAALGLDSHAGAAPLATETDFRWQPQAEGAVDDLVLLDSDRRVVAYQSKSGLGRLPRKTTTRSVTVDAIVQAGRELRAPGGAHLVVLVFGQLSLPMRAFSAWLRRDVALTPGQRQLQVMAELLGFAPDADWEQLRPRLRFLEMGSLSDLGANIDDELATAYSSPADRLSVADALRELVGKHSDVEGAKLPPIGLGALAGHLRDRGLRPLEGRGNLEGTPFERSARRFFSSIVRDRGPLPEIDRSDFVEHVLKRLEQNDVVLLGGGGSGKTELEAQILQHMFSDAWTPLVVRREDISDPGSAIAASLGAGGRTDLAALIVQRIAADPQERILVLVDGLDEIRRIPGPQAVDRIGDLSGLVRRLREILPNRDRVRILVSCRKYDWDALTSAGAVGQFEPVLVPSINREHLRRIDPGIEDFGAFVNRLTDATLDVLLSRPILLRLAFEVALQREDDETLPTQQALVDLGTESAIWRAYYHDCVCRSESGLAVRVHAGDVVKCHDAMARAHVETDRFVIAVPARPLERDHAIAFPWLRSLEVAVGDVGVALAERVRFFHSSYADFALALVVADDATLRMQLGMTRSLAVPLHPVWRRVARFWEDDSAGTVVARLLEILREPNVPYLVKRDFLAGVPAAANSPAIAPLLLAELATAPFDDAERLLLSLFEAVADQPASLRKITTESALLTALSERVHQVGGATLDEGLRALLKMLSSDGGPREELVTVARVAAREAFERAASFPAGPAGNHNATVLARRAAEGLSYALLPDLIEKLPVSPADWQPASPDRADVLAAVVRLVLTEPAALERMDGVSREATTKLLLRILGASVARDDRKVELALPQQTEMSFAFRLTDQWEMAWHNVHQALPKLIAKDVCYLDVAVFAWMVVGSASWRKRASDTFPLAQDGWFWHRDYSEHWWGESSSLGPHFHRLIAESGFALAGDALLAGDTRLLHRLHELAMNIRWPGLAAIFCGIVASRLSAADRLSAETKRDVARRAIELLTQPHALERSELRHDAAKAFPSVVANADDSGRERLWEAIWALSNLDTIASMTITEPNLDDVRRDWKESVEEEERKLADGKKQEFGGSLMLQFLHKMPPEQMYEQAMAEYRRMVVWRETAQRGEAPWEHFDVQYLLQVVKECVDAGQQSLVPADVLALYRKAEDVLGAEQLPVTMPAVRRTSRIGWRPSAEPERVIADPRAQFERDVGLLTGQHLNRAKEIKPEERTRILLLIETNRELVGLHEPSPVTPPPVSLEVDDWRAKQPFPKRAWLQLLVLYLDSLPDGASHALSGETLAALLALTRDRDPAENRAADSGELFTVRGLTAEGLALAFAHDGPVDLLDAFERLFGDPSPEVRRAAIRRAPKVSAPAFGRYTALLARFVQWETDPYLLGRWGAPLFNVVPPEERRSAYDDACAHLLSRCLRTSAVSLPARAEVGGNSEVSDYVAWLVVAVVSSWPAPATEATLATVLARPLSDLVDHTLLAQLVGRLVESVVRSHHEEGREFALLQFIDRASHEIASLPSQHALAVAELRGLELETATRVCARLGCAIAGLQQPDTMPLNLSPFPNASRWKRLPSSARSWEPRLRALWACVVTAWLRSDIGPSAQRLLSDALRVARSIMSEEPLQVVNLLREARLERFGYFERAVANELVAVLRELLLGAYALTSAERTALTALLDLLARGGHESALVLVADLAAQARE